MAITIGMPGGKQVQVEADSALIGRDGNCPIAFPQEKGLQPIHARIRKVAGRWLVEAQGDWPIRVGDGLPGRMSWLKPGDVIRLTEAGPEITFHDAPGPAAKGPGPQAPATAKPVAAPPAAKVPGRQAAPKAKPAAAPPELAVPLALPVSAEVEKWFYSIDGRSIGPVSMAKLKRLARSGKLLPEDVVWKKGMADWVEAGSLPGLFRGGRAT
jgi:hypothetical protein